jgi:cytochrome c-type biogenesis protein CcmH/NrfG
VLRLVATTAIVFVVAFASRTAPSDAGASAESVRCELEPPADISGLEACLVQFPEDVQLLIDLGMAYTRAGRAEDARASYRRALEIDPRDRDVQRRITAMQPQPGLVP